MDGREAELRDAVRRWAEEALRRGGEHPSFAALAACAAGEASDADALRNHLAICPECTRLVLDLLAFPDLEPAAGVAPLTPDEIAEDWERVSARLPGSRPAAADMRRRAAPASTVRRWLPWAAAAAFAGLFVITAFWGIGVRRERDRLAQPQANLVAVELVPVETSRGEGEDAEVVLSPRGGPVAVTLSLSKRPAEDYDAFELEVRADRGELWSGAVGEPDEGLYFGVVFPAGFLAPGRYDLWLFGRRGGERAPLGRYALTVAEE